MQNGVLRLGVNFRAFFRKLKIQEEREWCRLRRALRRAKDR